MVKWLEEIEVADSESDNHYHFMDNRVLPSHVDEALAKEEGMLYCLLVYRSIEFEDIACDKLPRACSL